MGSAKKDKPAGPRTAVPFSDSELLVLLEAARVTLADADVFDQIAEDMDIADGPMRSLRDRLQAYLDS